MNYIKLFSAFLDMLDEREKKKVQGYDADVEVTRVENGQVYVHIPGGIPETPVQKCGATVEKGDNVHAHIAGKKVWVDSNITHPSTDDTMANKANNTAKTAEQKADKAQETADEANETAKSTSQYFWYKNGTGSEAGAHVTEVPEAEFETEPQGGNLLMRSNQIKLRLAAVTLTELSAAGLKVYEQTDSTNPVAQFLADKALIGKENEKHIQVDSGGMHGMVNATENPVTLDFSTGSNLKTADLRVNHNEEGYENTVSYLALRTSSDHTIFPPMAQAQFVARFDDGTHFNEAILDILAGQNYRLVQANCKLQLINDGVFSTLLDVEGHAEMTGKLTAGAINGESLFDVSSHAFSINASSTGNFDEEITATKTGYYPLAVAGFLVSTGGAFSRGAYISARSQGRCTMHARIHANTTGTKIGNVFVLWVKNTYSS